ncbi:MAG: hypothetical protein IKI93_13120 [Clostridia bacterium]|nr:hypothetical protein [Clostridia bacterium]
MKKKVIIILSVVVLVIAAVAVVAFLSAVTQIICYPHSMPAGIIQYSYS